MAHSKKNQVEQNQDLLNLSLNLSLHFFSADGCVLTADGYLLSTDGCSYEYLIAPDTLKSSYDNLI